METNVSQFVLRDIIFDEDAWGTSKICHKNTRFWCILSEETQRPCAVYITLTPHPMQTAAPIQVTAAVATVEQILTKLFYKMTQSCPEPEMSIHSNVI